MKKNAFFKKALTFISAAVMAGAIGLGAGIGSKVSADTTDSDTTNVILTKLQDNTDTPSFKDTDKAPDGSESTVAGAAFTVYDITDQYWGFVNDGTISGAVDDKTGTENAEDMATAAATLANPAKETDKQFNLKTAKKVVDNEEATDGTLKLNLPTESNGHKAVYEFVETKTPTGYKPSVNFVLSMASKADKNGILYVYPKDAVDVSYQIKFTKVDKNNQETTLAGATFNITNEAGTLYAQLQNDDGSVIKSQTEIAPGAQKVAWVEDQSAATVFTSDDNGAFGFKADPEKTVNKVLYGLSDSKAYAVHEISAPKGYNNDPELVDDKDATKATTEANDYKVTDTPEGILPHTGGAGIIAIVVAGLAIVTIGVIAYNRRRANA